MRPRKIFLFVLCFVSLIAFAMPGCKGKSKKGLMLFGGGTAFGPVTQDDITVRVVDRITGNPINGAEVDIDNGTPQITTSVGFTTFVGASGAHIITAKAAGYDISTVAFVGVENIILEVGLIDPSAYFDLVNGPHLTLSVLGVNENEGDVRVNFVIAGRDPAIAGLEYPELQLSVSGLGTSPGNVSVTLPNGSVPFGVTALVYNNSNDLVKIGETMFDTGIGVSGTARAIEVNVLGGMAETVSGVIDRYNIQAFTPDPYNADAAIYAVGPQGEMLVAGGFVNQFDPQFNTQLDAIRYPGISNYRFIFGIEDGFGGRTEAFDDTVGLPPSISVMPPDIPALIAPTAGNTNVLTRVQMHAYGFSGTTALAIEITDIPSGGVVTYRWRGIIHPAHPTLELPAAAELANGTEYRIRAISYIDQGYDFDNPIFPGDAAFTGMSDGRAVTAWRNFTTEF